MNKKERQQLAAYCERGLILLFARREGMAHAEVDSELRMLFEKIQTTFDLLPEGDPVPFDNENYKELKKCKTINEILAASGEVACDIGGNKDESTKS